MTGIRLTVNGCAIEMPEGSNVAAAIAHVTLHFRHAIRGDYRAPLCGMGVCYECRVHIDGVAHQRACMTPVRHGMQVRTDD